MLLSRPIALAALFFAVSNALQEPAWAQSRSSGLVNCDSPAIAKAIASLVSSGELSSDRATEQALRLSGREDATYARDRTRPHWNGWSWKQSGFDCLTNAELSLTHWPAELTPLAEPEARARHLFQNRGTTPLEGCLTRLAFEQALSGHEQSNFQCRSVTSHGYEPGNVQCWQGPSRGRATWRVKLWLDDDRRCVRNLAAAVVEPAIKLTAEQQQVREDFYRPPPFPVPRAVPGIR